MKILQFIWNLNTGGAEKIVVELSNEFSKQHEVMICSIRPIEEWMRLPKKIAKQVKVYSINSFQKFSFSVLIRLLKLIIKEHPNVVHVHSSIIMFYIFFIAILFHNITFIHTIHTTLTPGFKKLFRFIYCFQIINNRFVHVCISQSLYQLYSRTYPHLTFTRVDNGIEPVEKSQIFLEVHSEIERLKKTTKTKVFTAIGNYSKFKNFTLLARVFKQLEEQEDDLILIIIGEDRSPEKVNYKEVLKHKGSNTFLLGTKSNTADYLLVSDALVMSSTMEGMPLVVLEAFSIGLPVISTPAGGVVDLVKDGKNGFIAENFSEEALIKAIKGFLKADKSLIHQIKYENQKKFQSDFTMEVCAANYLRLYRASL